jgi:hypothetical protein
MIVAIGIGGPPILFPLIFESGWVALSVAAGAGLLLSAAIWCALISVRFDNEAAA